MPLNFIHDFSAIRDIVSKKIDVTAHRQIFVFAGDETWQKDVLKEILHGHEESSLWVGDEPPESFPNILLKKVQNWLGRERHVVIFDANKDFSADAFAAISGVVVGGGSFILLMPAEESWEQSYSTYFGQRLIKSIRISKTINIINQADKKIHFVSDVYKSSKKKTCDSPFLTSEQQDVVINIEKEVYKENKVPVVLVSDRGRGKSAALGITAARLLKSEIKKIIITAPRMRATDVVFKHVKQLLPEADINRGKIKLKNSVIQFYAPDQLSIDKLDDENITADLLLVDEAAAIPVPILSSFLKQFPQCVFATTVHGYEGTGRGFSVRFKKVLDKYYPGWINLKMKTPIRWAENDPLESWSFRLLCLDAEITYGEKLAIDINNLEYHLLTKEQLANDEDLLNEVFALLILAHYRTRPSDLKNILDDNSLSVYIAKYKNKVVAVAVVSREGLFSNELSTLIYHGERRPPGHLLAQTLTYHCGVENAATLDYARIMRIVVHPEHQGKGIGTSILKFIVNNEKNNGRDIIGTSFGLNTSLFNFWTKSNFIPVRIGLTREQTSGEHAAIMLLALSNNGKIISDEVDIRFKAQISFLLDDVLNDLSFEIKETLITEEKYSDKLTAYEKKDLESFISDSRNYELCISCLKKFVMSKQSEINKTDFPVVFSQILLEKVSNNVSWKELAKIMCLTGQNEARKLFRQAIVYLQE